MGSGCPLLGTVWSSGTKVLLRNHNIRHDLIPREFGNWRAYIICASAPLSFLGAVRTNLSSALRRCARE